MPSFQESIFLFVLALMLFGPKQLPKLARELGKWMGEFRRASNEFKMQMEEEMRISEQADRQKEVAAMEAAAPVQATPSNDSETPVETINPELSTDIPGETPIDSPAELAASESSLPEPAASEVISPLPIATSGDLKMMPPATGLPTARKSSSALGGLIDSIPEAESQTASTPTESAPHGE
jgi:sec-independent protein translocase protein TatB